MRVFLDTNVLVSAFATRGLCADVFRYVLAEHDMLTGEVNIVELRRVLRGRIKVPTPVIASIEELLRDQTVVPKPAEPHSLEIRDPDDRWVLASAVDGKADVLVTGDSDLLEAASRAPIRVLNPRGFWEMTRSKSRKKK